MADVAAETPIAFVTVVALDAHAALHVPVVMLLLLLHGTEPDTGVVDGLTSSFVHCLAVCLSAGHRGELGFDEPFPEVLHEVVSGFDFGDPFCCRPADVKQALSPLFGFTRGASWVLHLPVHFGSKKNK